MSRAQLNHQNSMAEPLAELSARLKAAADPLRIEVLRVLSRGSYGVLELCRIFDIKQSGMSHHLKVMANAGLVATRREGNSIYYRRAHFAANHPHHSLQSALYSAADQLDLSNEVRSRLAEIQQERAQASKVFFAENADKFRAQQDLIASYPIYGDHVSEMLAKIHPSNTDSVLEVGPGEGEFLEVLSKRFKKVYALDNSANMLNKAKVFAESQQLNNISFILGDTQSVANTNLKTTQASAIKVDCVVMNMVLHHTPSPGDIFQDLSSILKTNGNIIVTDLCRHDQQWASDACGDLWLGFEPPEFSNWAKAAGLEEGQSNFFALRNGFQIQFRHFFKS
ncbi:ArsR/SmtB family transcription factor [Aurantivibrio infirmus]